MTDNWHKSVYGFGKEGNVELDKINDLITQEDWPTNRRKAIRRDHQKCRRCDMTLGYDLCSVHHIKPRAEGGTAELSNLITLCNSCHDWVECHVPPLTTKNAIEGSMPSSYNLESFDEGEWKAPNWHTVVYGGVRR